MKPEITVIIATHNRQDFLAETLNDLAAQQTGSSFQYEVLVVDNASTDATRSVVEKNAGHFPVKLSYLYEGHKGKAYALNAGITVSQAPILVFTDDDVKLQNNWLLTIWETFQKHKADGVGGPVKPFWIGDRPSWLGEKLLRQIGVADHGNETFVVKDISPCFIGPNCAYQREIFNAIGVYDVARTGVSEDADFFIRAFQANFKLVYEPKTAVENKIEAKRWTRKTLSTRFFKQGRACALGLQEQGQYRGIFRIPLWVIRYYFQLHFSALIEFLKGNREEALWHWLRRHFYGGAIYYCFLDWWNKHPIRPAVKPGGKEISCP